MFFSGSSFERTLDLFGCFVVCRALIVVAGAVTRFFGLLILTTHRHFLAFSFRDTLRDTQRDTLRDTHRTIRRVTLRHSLSRYLLKYLSSHTLRSLVDLHFFTSYAHRLHLRNRKTASRVRSQPFRHPKLPRPVRMCHVQYE